MKGWVIAHSLDQVANGERAFVQQLGSPGPGRLTYSSVMTAAECEAIDFASYRDARSWCVKDGLDRTVMDGVSLGRAFEYTATETLVRHRRAALVLGKLLEDSRDKTVRLRGVGTEWWTMALALGADPIAEGRGLVASPDGGAHPTSPSRSCRLMARLAAIRPPKSPWLALMGAPLWTRPYHRILLRGSPAQLVDPGRGVLVCAIGLGTRTSSLWLADLDRKTRVPTLSDGAVASPSQEPLRAVENRFQALQVSIGAWAKAGRRIGRPGAVAVAAQDVLAPARAFLLGFQAAGGKVITLEHGVSGGYTELVSSVANTFAAWGEPQAAYTREASSAGLSVVSVGWARLETCAALPAPAGDDAWDLLHFSQPSEDLSAGNWPEDNLLAVQMVEEYARLHPNRRVAVKLHPASRLLGFSPPPIRHAQLVTADSLSLIRSARVVIVGRSTTGLEAMCVGRPVLQVPALGYIGASEFIRDSGAARMVESADELAAAMDRLLSDRSSYVDAIERGRAYARSFVQGFGQPGAAVKRLVELVAESRHS